jgi:hypothetical protein
MLKVTSGLAYRNLPQNINTFLLKYLKALFLFYYLIVSNCKLSMFLLPEFPNTWFCFTSSSKLQSRFEQHQLWNSSAIFKFFLLPTKILSLYPLVNQVQL